MPVMPGRDYERYRLSRHHMNDLFRAIESSSIPISDFELTQITLPFDMTSKDERMRYSWPVTTIYHLNTSSIFAIAQFYGERFRLRSQWGYRGSENEFFGEWPSEPGTHQSWETVLFLFNVWKNCVEIILTQRAAERKRKEDLEGVTDLWEELKRGRRLPAEDHEQDIENTPFSSAEQAEIALRIGQAKDYIRTSSALTSDQIARVEARFEHAEEASRRIGR